MVPPLPLWWWIFKARMKKDLFADMDDEGGMEVVRAGLKAAGGRALAGRVACVMGLQLGPRLKEIGVPTLVIHGKRDHFVPHAAADTLARNIPHARQAWVDAPHAISWIRPKETAELIVRFMRTLH
jgi:pimeloyl-ACP methyl ester carboxylesterase